MADRYPEDWETSDSDIECAHCGERFYYELTRCPNCGRDVYEPEYDEDNEIWGVDPERDTLEEWFDALVPAAAIFLGIVASFVSAIALFIGLRFLLPDFVMTWPGRALLLASVPVGAAIGGITAGAIENEHPQRMGWWVGVLSTIAAVVLASVDRDFSTSGWAGWDTIPLWLVTVLSGAAGGEFLRRRRRSDVVNALFGLNETGGIEEEESLYEDLFVRTGYDVERVERLIELERKFMPNANRRTLIESAINRWERDNR